MSTLTTHHERILLTQDGRVTWKEVSRTFALCPQRYGNVGHDSLELTEVTR